MEKILLVEDESVVALATSQTLKMHGYDVIIALSGEEAIRTVYTTDDIRLILMDVALGPGIDGAETAQIILRNREIPIVFLSSHMEEEIVLRTRNVTSYGYVVKHTGATVLLTSITMAFRLHQAHQELQETREYLGKIINSLIDPIFVKDRNHRWVLLNDEFCSFVSLPREELLGKHDYDLFPEEEARVFWEQDDKVLRTGDESINEELLTDGQEVVHTIVTKKALYIDKRGNPLIVGVIRDVTAEKEAQKALREALEEKEALLKELQHRVKNSFTILTSLLNFETAAAQDEETLQVLRRVDARIRSISNLYTILGSSENIRMINLRDYLRKIVLSLQESFGTSARRTKVNFEAEDISVGTKHAMALGLIVNELVTNAYKYAMPLQTDGYIAVTLDRTDREIRLAVENSGNFFPKNFDAEASPGLGLNLVRLLTEQHAGKINLETGDYSRFTVRFPH